MAMCPLGHPIAGIPIMDLDEERHRLGEPILLIQQGRARVFLQHPCHGGGICLRASSFRMRLPDYLASPDDRAVLDMKNLLPTSFDARASMRLTAHAKL